MAELVLALEPEVLPPALALEALVVALDWVPDALEEPLEPLDALGLDLLDPQPATSSSAARQVRVAGRPLSHDRRLADPPADLSPWAPLQ